MREQLVPVPRELEDRPDTHAVAPLPLLPPWAKATASRAGTSRLPGNIADVAKAAVSTRSQSQPSHSVLSCRSLCLHNAPWRVEAKIFPACPIYCSSIKDYISLREVHNSKTLWVYM